MSFDVHGFRRFSCLFFLSFEGHSGLTLRLIEVIFLFVRDVASVFSEQLVLRQGFDLRDDFIVTVLQANEHDDQGDDKSSADDAGSHEDPESPCRLDTLVSRLPRSVVIFIALLNRHVIDYFISVPVHIVVLNIEASWSSRFVSESKEEDLVWPSCSVLLAYDHLFLVIFQTLVCRGLSMIDDRLSRASQFDVDLVELRSILWEHQAVAAHCVTQEVSVALGWRKISSGSCAVSYD